MLGTEAGLAATEHGRGRGLSSDLGAGGKEGGGGGGGGPGGERKGEGGRKGDGQRGHDPQWERSDSMLVSPSDIAGLTLHGIGLCRFNGVGAPMKLTVALDFPRQLLRLIFHKAMTWTKTMEYKLTDTLKAEVLQGRGGEEAVRVSGHVGDRVRPGAVWLNLQLKFTTNRNQAVVLRDHIRRVVTAMYSSYVWRHTRDR